MTVVECGWNRKPLRAMSSRLTAKRTMTRTSLTTVTAMTCEQKGPAARISRTTAMALAGDRATPRVATREATAMTCALERSARKVSWRPTARKARKTKTQVNEVMHAVITSVGRGFFRMSATCSSAPAATPMTARHKLSTTASFAVTSFVRRPRTCCPASTPTVRLPLMRGRRAR